MWLTNLRLPGKLGYWSISIHNDKIASVHPSAVIAPPRPYSRPLSAALANASSPPILPLDDAIVFPGLINSHDHLDFNLFPALGNTRYDNYRAWGRDIHSNNSTEIAAVQKIPLQLRTSWGIYKNLFNGFTTVVNHGDRLDTTAAPITVFQSVHNLHSVGFQPRWLWKLNRPFSSPLPFVLHVGEGTDDIASKEIATLIRWNLFKRPLIGIHGVAMTEEQATHFRALVWCPASNYFLLDRTAPIQRLKTQVPILFGTDSTLTAPWDCWSQIRLARQEKAATDEELLDMLTTNPATTWRLPDRGRLAEGLQADLVIARPRSGAVGWDAFYQLTPDDILLVLTRGKLALFDASLKEVLTDLGLINDQFTQAGPNGKYVLGDITGLMQQIRNYYPDIQFPALPVSQTK